MNRTRFRFASPMRAAGTLLLGTTLVSGLALAAPENTNPPGKDWIPRAKVEQILIKDGFSQITGIHARQGRWEGRGVEDAISYRFTVDPHTGDLSKTRIDAPDN